MIESEDQLRAFWVHSALSAIGDLRVETPFRHAVLDGFLPPDLFEEISRDLLYRCPPREQWNRYEAPFERKVALPCERIPESLRLRWLVETLNSRESAQLIGEGMGHDLLPDPARIGGGINWVGPDDFLKLHADANVVHSYPDRRRRVNLIYYVHPTWERAWDGDLELWPAIHAEGRWWPDGARAAEAVKIEPVPNRLVVFEVCDTSMHGHPNPIRDSRGNVRFSLALFYFAPYSPERYDREVRGVPSYCEPYFAGSPSVDYWKR